MDFPRTRTQTGLYHSPLINYIANQTVIGILGYRCCFFVTLHAIHFGGGYKVDLVDYIYFELNVQYVYFCEGPKGCKFKSKILKLI